MSSTPRGTSTLLAEATRVRLLVSRRCPGGSERGDRALEASEAELLLFSKGPLPPLAGAAAAAAAVCRLRCGPWLSARAGLLRPLQDEMLGSVRDQAGGAWCVLVMDSVTTKVLSNVAGVSDVMDFGVSRGCCPKLVVLPVLAGVAETQSCKGGRRSAADHARPGELSATPASFPSAPLLLSAHCAHPPAPPVCRHSRGGHHKAA